MLQKFRPAGFTRTSDRRPVHRPPRQNKPNHAQEFGHTACSDRGDPFPPFGRVNATTASPQTAGFRESDFSHFPSPELALELELISLHPSTPCDAPNHVPAAAIVMATSATPHNKLFGAEMKYAAITICCVCFLAGCSKQIEIDESTVHVEVKSSAAVFRKKSSVWIDVSKPVPRETLSGASSLAALVAALELGPKQVRSILPEGLEAFTGHLEVKNGGAVFVYESSRGVLKLQEIKTEPNKPAPAQRP